jgi:hypothetical protein
VGREVKRVPSGFNWPLGKIWKGFVNNPHRPPRKCGACKGTGSSTVARHLKDLWYGYAPFKPEDRGSKPFLLTDEHVVAFALRNVERAPEYYGTGRVAVLLEAARLAVHWNGSWCHHLNDRDIAALIKSGRLMEFTHDFIPGEGWRQRDPCPTPSARDVNIWSCVAFGHDSINQWIVAGTECKRLGVSHICDRCRGSGQVWSSRGARKRYESWVPTEPPAGDWWQVWETVTEGSPVTPAFATREELIDHLVARGDAWDRKGGDGGWSRDSAESFVTAEWSPTLIGVGGRVYQPRDGVPQ